jgi:hypothetical protein
MHGTATTPLNPLSGTDLTHFKSAAFTRKPQRKSLLVQVKTRASGARVFVVPVAGRWVALRRADAARPPAPCGQYVLPLRGRHARAGAARISRRDTAARA